jgi:hypothetical protein
MRFQAIFSLIGVVFFATQSRATEVVSCDEAIVSADGYAQNTRRQIEAIKALGAQHPAWGAYDPNEGHQKLAYHLFSAAFLKDQCARRNTEIQDLEAKAQAAADAAANAGSGGGTDSGSGNGSDPCNAAILSADSYAAYAQTQRERFVAAGGQPAPLDPTWANYDISKGWALSLLGNTVAARMGECHKREGLVAEQVARQQQQQADQGKPEFQVADCTKAVKNAYNYAFAGMSQYAQYVSIGGAETTGRWASADFDMFMTEFSAEGRSPEINKGDCEARNGDIQNLIDSISADRSVATDTDKSGGVERSKDGNRSRSSTRRSFTRSARFKR